MTNNSYEKLEQALNYKFSDQQLLVQALTHKSIKTKPNNERLEFLGDSIVNLIVSQYLYHHLEQASEGDMSKIRSSIINEPSLTKMADQIHIRSFIKLSLGEENNQGRNKPSLISDAFEAVIAAIYLDSDLETVIKVLSQLIEKTFKTIDLSLFRDYKTQLQEMVQAKYKLVPEYILLEEVGPDHDKQFKIEVRIDDKAYAIGLDRNKKGAQQIAASKALAMMLNEQADSQDYQNLEPACE